MARILGGLRKYLLFVCLCIACLSFCWAERGQLLACAHFEAAIFFNLRGKDIMTHLMASR